MFSNAQKTRIINIVTGTGFYRKKQIGFGNVKSTADCVRRIDQIITLLDEIVELEDQKEQGFSFADELINIKELCVFEMMNAFHNNIKDNTSWSKQYHVKLFNNSENAKRLYHISQKWGRKNR